MLRDVRLQSTLAAMACLLFVCPAVVRAEEIPAEQRLPPGVLAFFTVPNATELKDGFLESGFGQMVQDDSLDAFRSQLEAAWEDMSAEVEEEVGVPAADLLKLASGEVTGAVLQPPGRSFGMIGILGIGGQRETLDALLEKFREAAEADGAVRTVETIEDTDVTVFKKEKDDGEPDTVAYFIRDERLVISFGNGTDLLQDVLVRWDGEHAQTFADEPVYSYIMQQCAQDGASQFRWYFSPIDLFRTIAMMPQMNQGGVSPAMALGFLPALGLDKFKAMGGASSMGTDEFDGVSRTFLYVNQPTSGLCKFFACRSVRQDPPNWVPADVSAYSSANWDIEGAYAAVEAVVDFFQPPGTLSNMIDQLSKQGPQIHIKEDVIDTLTGRLQMLGHADAEAEPEGGQPGVFAFEVRAADKVSDVLRRVAEFSQGSLTDRDFRGVTIYEAEIPNFQGGEPQTMGVAVARGQLFVAMDVRQLESYLRDDEAEEPLANSTEYRRVSAHFPSETSIISFARPAAQLKPIYEQLRSGQMDAITGDIDFSTLPDFDELAKFFTTTGGYAVPDEKGALFVQFSLPNE